MHDDSDVKKAAAEYEVLKIVMHGLNNCDHDLPDALFDRQSLAISRLSLSVASSGSELAHKAFVLRDLLVAEDIIGTLTMSLCQDAERLFPITPIFSTRLLNHNGSPAAMSALSLDELLKLARLFTN
jgi:hypothetical protein